MKIKKRYVVYFLLLISLGGLVSYRIVKNKTTAPAPQAGRGGGGGGPVRVDGMVVRQQIFVDSLSVKGSIEANEQIQIRSQVSGVVTAIYFKEGGLVKKGQVLLQIDRSELNAQLSQAHTQEQLAGENARRAKLLLEKEAIVPVQNGKKVFVAKNGKVKEVMVETANRTATDVLVTSGLQNGDTVLTTGILTLKNGNAPCTIIRASS